ncbi:MAG: CxxxxCH/CxxCH domain-containing protein [Desulfuromonadales bacterium]|nr:CxxxxCH/CxxCH domain-containing protein [Desulfuromonadales bacterium]
MRPRELFPLILLIAMLAIPTVALAGIPTGPPPGPAPTYSIHTFDCEECHGPTMDLSSVSNMICLKCHKDGGAVAPVPPNGWPSDGYPRDGVTDRQFSSDDASNAMGNNNSATLQTSHNWAAQTNYIPAAGAQPPINPAFNTNYGATNGKLACSGCHLPHEDTDNPQLLIMGAGSANAMCVDCHRAWNQAPGNDGWLTHPMVGDYSTYAGTPGFKASLDNKNNSDVQLVSGGISCTTCHGVHWVDSDSLTVDGYDQTINPGDGKLLRADGEQKTVSKSGPSTPAGVYATGGSVCTVCHDYETSFHGNNNDVGCLACHGGHNYNDGQPTFYMLNDSTGSYTSRPTNSVERSLAWVGSSQGTVDGFCETCHGDIGAWDSPRDHLAGFPGEDCSACHGLHSQGSFSEPVGCNGCHGFPPQVDAPGYNAAAFPANTPAYAANGYAYANSAGLVPADGSATPQSPYSYLSDDGTTIAAQHTFYKNETETPHTTHAGTTSNYGYQCSLCHNTHIDEFSSTHNKGNLSFQDVLESGYAFNPLTNVAGVTPSYNESTGVCSNLYCHSNGVASAPTYNSPTWADGAGEGSKGSFGIGTGAECDECHGNTAATMAVNNNSDAHQRHLGAGTQGKTFGCQVCHTDTASSSTAVLASAKGSGGVHVDGEATVAFISSGNALYNALNGSTYTDPADGTCANYCHEGTGSPSFNGTGTPDWDDALSGSAAVNCRYCHGGDDSQDPSMVSGSHNAHINGATLGVGRNIACGDCHGNTVTTEDNLTLTNAANHVDAQIDLGIVMETGPLKTSCSNIDCHSGGNYDGTRTYKQSGVDYTWGGAALDCDDCHGGSKGAYTNVSWPLYNNAGIGGDANSHLAHVGNSEFTCRECHVETSLDGTALNGTDISQHVDFTHDVRGRYINNNTAGLSSYNPTTNTCSAIACHGGNDAVWGGSVSCRDCHVGANDVDNFENDEVAAVIKGSEYNTVGHGQVAIGLVAKANGGNDCLWCHDETAGHEIDDANPFRLKGSTYNSGAFGWNGACLVCHDSDETTNYNAGEATFTNLDRNAVVKVDKWHQMDAHTQAGDNGGMFCWDCHDPHGDGSNKQMIQSYAAVQTDGTYGVPEVISPGVYNTVGAPIVFTDNTKPVGAGGFAVDTTYNAAGGAYSAGVCNACHTESASNPKMQHYTSTSSDDHNAGTVCTTCHKHSADTTNDGFAFAGSGCNGCHGDATAGNFWPDTAGYNDATEDDAGRHQTHIEVLSQRVYNVDNTALLSRPDADQIALCEYCHDNPGGDSDHGNPLNLPAENSFYAIWDKSADSNGSYATPHSSVGGNDTCSNIDCHNAKTTTDDTFGWYDAGTSSCIMCHRDVTDNTAGTTGATHNAHYNSATAPIYGLTADNCAYCHDAATDWTSNTQPASGHISGAFNVSGSVSFTYNGVYYNAGTASAAGSCGVNDCHNDGRNGSIATGDYNWGDNNTVSCAFCHSTNGVDGTNAHNAHFDGLDTFYTGGTFMDCAKCHTHNGPDAVFGNDDHMSGTINIAGTMNYNSTVANLNVATLADYGTCSTTTCHNDGKSTPGAVKTPFWNETVDAANSCAICHFASDTGATNAHDTHIDDANVTKYNAAVSKGSNTDEYEFSCAYCHDNDLSAHIKGSVTYNATINTDYTVTTPGSCNANLCHNDGTVGMSNAPVEANWTTGWPAGDTDGSCNNCHGNAPDTNAHADHDVGIHFDDIYDGTGDLVRDTNSSPNAHGDSATSTTISCYSCHNETVYAKDNRFGSECSSCHGSGGYATTNVAASIGNFNMHVNFNREVAFNAATFKTNAQVRDIIGDAAEVGATWNRYNGGTLANAGGGYKTSEAFDVAKAGLNAASFDGVSCSNVACHNNITTPEWTTPTVEKGNCMACHKELPQ